MIHLIDYSGHIRNWRALCMELKVDGQLVREEREKALLVAAYRKWGGQMGNHIHGSFALVLRDDEKDLLFCLRDPFGTKPLYYYQTADGQLLAGTQIRPILKADGFVKELNEKMLQTYLTLTYCAGEETFFKGLKSLMPGRYLLWKDEKKEIVRYWRPEFRPEEEKCLEDFADEIHETLKMIMKEVKEEGEVAESFLSGGVDSSYVLAMSDAETANSCGYEDERFDESPLAAETANFLGRKLDRRVVEPEEYFAAIPYVMEHMELPLADASAIVFAIGCRTVAEHAALCYSGEGADEFFGGYNMYRNAERYGDDLPSFYVGNTNIMKEEEKERLLVRYDPAYRPIDLMKDLYAEMKEYDPLTKMSSVDIQVWLPGDIYLNVDKMSRAAGLEIRMPLTDRRVFDIASRMPSRYKVNEEQNKVAFRTAAAKMLPEEVAFRKKLGFIVPIRHWMADARYNGDVIKRLTGRTAEKFFRREELDAIWQEYLDGNSDLWRKVYTIYTFLVWYEIYFGEETI